MEETLVIYEIAKLLKEKGFDEYCFKGYITKTQNLTSLRQIDFDKCSEVEEKELFYEFFFKNSEVINDYSITAPTQSLAQKWLREVHNIHIELQFDTISYGYRIFNPFKSEDYFTDWKYETWKYEECLEASLQEALKLI